MEQSYQKQANKFALEVTEELKQRIELRNLEMLHYVMGICTEVSEINLAYDEVDFHLYKVDIVNLQEELGDICWYTGNLAEILNIELEWGIPDNVFDRKETDLLDFYARNHTLSIISGDFLDLLKKNIFYGVKLDETKISEKLPDLAFLLSKMAELVGVDISEVHKRNINKLTVRYNEKFTEEAAVNRDLDAEREALEAT